MKLVRINGLLSDLTMFDSFYEKTKIPEEDFHIVNEAILKNKSGVGNPNFDRSKGLDHTWYRISFMRPGVVKSKAHAVINIGSDDYKRYEIYDIYYSTKGFYCNVRKERIYLNNLEWEAQ